MQEKSKISPDNADHMLLKEALVEVARNRGTITYGEIAPLLGLNTRLSCDRTRLMRVLHSVCGGEKDCGMPLLGAVVVAKATGIPGKGFFAFSRELGFYADSDNTGEAAREYHRQELRRVHDAWEAIALSARST